MREVLVLAAALSIPDPRERPADREEAARQKHARFADEHSDFVSYLNLWHYLREQRKELSGNAFRRMCREEFLHYLRIREWQDLVGQLRSIARDIGIRESATEPADPARVHAALLAGLLSHIGLREGDSREYLGARNSRFVLAPGSVLTKRPPRWVVVADLVETSRLYGRIAARIEPEVGRACRGRSGAAHLQRAALGRATRRGDGLRAGDALRAAAGAAPPRRLRRRSIRWSRASCSSGTRSSRATGRPATTSSATTRGCGRNSPSWRSGPAAATCWSATTRSTPSTTRAIPADVVSARHFDAWWKKQRHQTPDLLTFTRDDLLRADDAADADRPDTWQAGDLSLPLTYRFEPGAADDGVTVHVPVDVLARLGGDEFAWQVPALREELVTALIRSLPKDLRRNFVPAPDTARAVLAAIDPAPRAAAGGAAARTAPSHRRSGAHRRVRPGQAAARICG